jgi:hypothetical protein
MEKIKYINNFFPKCLYNYEINLLWIPGARFGPICVSESMLFTILGHKNPTVELTYDVMKETEYFVSL